MVVATSCCAWWIVLSSAVPCRSAGHWVSPDELAFAVVVVVVVVIDVIDVVVWAIP